ncbi:MAG: hypothetical protein U0401_01385 [Anaerolineae bacterium]
MLPAILTASRRHRDTGDSHSEVAYRTSRENCHLALPPARLLNEADLMAELGLGRTPDSKRCCVGFLVFGGDFAAPRDWWRISI